MLDKARANAKMNRHIAHYPDRENEPVMEAQATLPTSDGGMAPS